MLKSNNKDLLIYKSIKELGKKISDNLNDTQELINSIEEKERKRELNINNLSMNTQKLISIYSSLVSERFVELLFRYELNLHNLRNKRVDIDSYISSSLQLLSKFKLQMEELGIEYLSAKEGDRYDEETMITNDPYNEEENYTIKKVLEEGYSYTNIYGEKHIKKQTRVKLNCPTKVKKKDGDSEKSFSTLFISRIIRSLHNILMKVK